MEEEGGEQRGELIDRVGGFLYSIYVYSAIDDGQD